MFQTRQNYILSMTLTLFAGFFSCSEDNPVEPDENVVEIINDELCDEIS